MFECWTIISRKKKGDNWRNIMSNVDTWSKRITESKNHRLNVKYSNEMNNLVDSGKSALTL